MKEATGFTIAATRAATAALTQDDDQNFAAANVWLGRAPPEVS